MGLINAPRSWYTAVSQFHRIDRPLCCRLLHKCRLWVWQQTEGWAWGVVGDVTTRLPNQLPHTLAAWGVSKDPHAESNSFILLFYHPHPPLLPVPWLPNVHLPPALVSSADFFCPPFIPEKVWHEGCLSWGLEGSGKRMRGHVFPQLSTNPFYLVTSLLIWFSYTHTHTQLQNMLPCNT